MLADPVFYCLVFSSRMLDVPKHERTLRTKFQLGAFIPIRRSFKTVCRLGGMVGWAWSRKKSVSGLSWSTPSILSWNCLSSDGLAAISDWLQRVTDLEASHEILEISNPTDPIHFREILSTGFWEVPMPGQWRRRQKPLPGGERPQFDGIPWHCLVWKKENIQQKEPTSRWVESGLLQSSRPRKPDMCEEND